MNARGLAASLAVVVTAALVLTTGEAANAAPEPPVIVVCPDVATYTLNTVPGGCNTMTTALTDAGVSGTPTRIEMMPGEYCPFEIDYGIEPLTIVGVGMAGIASGSPAVPEAALTTITWIDNPTCGAIPASVISLPGGRYQGNGINPATVTLQNITIQAANTGASGPTEGITASQGGSMDLRDVIVEGAGAVGLNYQTLTGDDTDTFTITNSEFANNAGTAIQSSSADARAASSPIGIVEETTIDSNGNGIVPGQGPLLLVNDTIANNGAGINDTDTDGQVIAKNTIVANNGASNDRDCYPSGPAYSFIWENGGFGGSTTNLTGTSCPKPAQVVVGGGTNPNNDITYSGSIATADIANGGPTPSDYPPTQAIAEGDTASCFPTGTDQREYPYTSGSACDIGALQTTATAPTPTGSADPSSHAFGTVAQGVQQQLAVTLSNSSNGLLGVSGVSFTSGAPDYSVGNDQCTFDALDGDAGSTCEVDIQFAPSSSGTDDGTLEFGTTAGPVDVDFTGAGGSVASVPDQPSAPTVTAGNTIADLAWSAGTNTGPTIATVTGYDTRYSSNGGSTWTPGPSTVGVTSTSTTVTGLTNGTSYVFEVAATSTVGDSAWSDPSAAVAPHPPADSSALSISRSTTISYGKSTVVSGTLTDTKTGKPVSGASVALKARAGVSGSFTTLTTKVTGSTGAVSVTVKPKVNSQYEWVYTATTAHKAVTSGVATIKVGQVVSITVKPKKVKHRKKVSVFGTVSPSASGKTVVLQRLVGGKWKKVGSATVRKQNLPTKKIVVSYLFHYKPKKKGKVSLRVISAATATNTAGTSATKKLKVT